MQPTEDAVERRIERAAIAARARLVDLGLGPVFETRIRVAPSMQAFHAITGTRDPLLRAWTAYDVIHLAPLGSWTDASDLQLERRLTHEFCHAALHQRFGTPRQAQAARIPRFFEEGVCSVLADQGSARLALDEICSSADPPLTARDFDSDATRAYAAAHHVMARIRDEAGADVFIRVLNVAVADGAPGCVERALVQMTGRDVVAWWARTCEHTA